MRRITVYIVSGILLLVLLAGTAVLVFIQDRKGPEIQISNKESRVYREGQEDKEILEGIKAIDDKDGDVTDSLMIESIKTNKAGSIATITLIAMDTHHNVTKVKYEIPCDTNRDADTENDENQDAGQPAETSGAETADEGTDATEPESEENIGGTGNTEEENQEQPESDTAAQVDAEIAALPSGSPIFRLNTYETTLALGEDFQYTDYIDDITDDKDDRADLFRKIQIENNVNTDQAGVYDVSYYVIDKDGNQSNVAKLKVNVE